MKTIFIVRGLPGSGKSVLAHELVQNYSERGVAHCEADHYFMKSGRYVFDKKRLGAAHQQCLSKFITALENPNINYIVQSNTNITWSEVKPYIFYSAIIGATAYLTESRVLWYNDPIICWLKNTHNVNLDTIRKMSIKFQSNEHIRIQSQIQFSYIIF
jgi:hypothetical protein